MLAARQLGFSEAPVMTARGWTPAQKRAYCIADNRLAENASWNSDLLSIELDELRDFDFDLLLIGFDAQTLNSMVGVPHDEPDSGDEIRANDVPTVSGAVVTRPGDLWRLGRHRLLCCDCRDPLQMSALIGDARINLAFTSPPYAEQRSYDASSGFRPVPPDRYVEWFAPVAANVAQSLAPDGSWFVNIKPSCEGLDTSLYVFDLVIAHVRKWGWRFATEFCWERPGVPKSVSRRFKNAFEPIYQFTLGDWKMRPDAVRHASDSVRQAGGPGVGDTSWKSLQGSADIFAGRDTVEGLAYPSNRLPTFAGTHESLGHAAAFPVGLPEFFVRAYTDGSDRVLDPFTGSGSTIIACERTGRIGLGAEISPQYCDIAVARWEKYTGGTAIRDSDGVSFGEARHALAR